MARRDESGRGLLPDLPPTYTPTERDPDPAADKEASPLPPRPEDRALAHGIARVYGNASLFGLIRWLLSIAVLGSAGRVVAVGAGIPSVLPLAGYSIACASLNVLLVLAHSAMKPASPTTPRPAGWYVALLVASPVLWVAAVATGLDMIVLTKDHSSERDPDAITYCGKFASGPCHPDTDPTPVFKAAVFCTSFSFAALLSCIVQCYHLSKLKRDNFTPEEIRYVHDSAALQKALSMPTIKGSWRHGWKKGTNGG
ncbi:Uncharacterized protein TPAR_02786 [Tolypocladium paradoxum]|uniref:MARVEL domain-containing protein n=1 Tax=Tolypocladium paradoxum TaxID=94208 RepID=A0A2S4L3K7_9HYPO|nr:Uncharacterized protein TPAR_02786 [Tolypocladium paradoxum]